MIRILVNPLSTDLHIQDMNNLYVAAESQVNGLIFGEQMLRDSAVAQRLMLEGKLQLSDGLQTYTGKAAVDLVNGFAAQMTKDGKPIITASDRPKDHYRCFSSRGDDLATGKIGEGSPLLFDVAPKSAQEVDVRFIDSMYVRDGVCLYGNASLGSYLSIGVVCPANYPSPNATGTGKYDVVGASVVPNALNKGLYDILPVEKTVYRFLNEVTLFGLKGEFKLDTPEPFQLRPPYFLRFKIYNASEDTNLNAAVVMGLYRQRTI